jgi:hypothetical protein
MLPNSREPHDRPRAGAHAHISLLSAESIKASVTLLLRANRCDIEAKFEPPPASTPWTVTDMVKALIRDWIMQDIHQSQGRFARSMVQAFPEPESAPYRLDGVA